MHLVSMVGLDATAGFGSFFSVEGSKPIGFLPCNRWVNISGS
ncbi:hypothetical protein C900_00667 [Fulvivirga imtechensis AK7]|uniref:Uncharacterized protein n=1 Tax=Fulvivirga imtechensis AK7 TaxID=1237149 RepID=L8JLC0_9BACT|nr:hypothetical protein C900_00667 [Fulvivirga imtechensis AK7]